jgi:predicted TIM-barrel fold metal-dependent hydrolase
MAARLGVPLFVHPVSPRGYTEHLAPHGQVGILMARGTEAAASVLSLVRNGTLAALPDLTIVIPMMSASILLFAGLLDHEGGREQAPDPPPSALMRRLYVDTMGFDPHTMRFAVETVGADHLLVGSDWPITPIAARDRVEKALNAAGIQGNDRIAVLGGNARALLSRR